MSTSRESTYPSRSKTVRAAAIRAARVRCPRAVCGWVPSFAGSTRAGASTVVSLSLDMAVTVTVLVQHAMSAHDDLLDRRGRDGAGGREVAWVVLLAPAHPLEDDRQLPQAQCVPEGHRRDVPSGDGRVVLDELGPRREARNHRGV